MTDETTTTTDSITDTQKMYNALLALTGDNLGLYYTDEISGMGEPVRTFSYGVGIDPSVWLKPYSLSCSGSMFTLNKDGTMKDIVCRPMDKFFEYMENSFTDSLVLDGDVQLEATVKQDGVSISSYLSDGYLYLKTKSSIYSDIAVLAMQTINKPEYADLNSKILEYEKSGYTVNLEYVSPENRIILYYEKSGLILLNIRNRETGEYLPQSTLYADPVMRKYMTDGGRIANVPEWIDAVAREQNVEGFVCTMDDGTMFKVKTNWYQSMIVTRNAIIDDRVLYNAISMGATQDIVNLLKGYDYGINKTLAFENMFLTTVNTATQLYLDIYNSVNGKEYRDYVVSAKTLLKSKGFDWLYQPLVKNYNKPIDYDMLVVNISSLFIENYKLYIPKGFEAAIRKIPRTDC